MWRLVSTLLTSLQTQKAHIKWLQRKKHRWSTTTRRDQIYVVGLPPSTCTVRVLTFCSSSRENPKLHPISANQLSFLFYSRRLSIFSPKNLSNSQQLFPLFYLYFIRQLSVPLQGLNKHSNKKMSVATSQQA